MKVTLQLGGASRTLELEQVRSLGGDLDRGVVGVDRAGPWSCQFRLAETGWMFDLRAGSQPETTLNGADVVGNWWHPIDYGDVIAAGALTITIGYLETTLPATPPLSAQERTLLGLIARTDDDGPRRVLADLWQEGEDDLRGTLIHAQCEGLELEQPLLDGHGSRWRAPAIAAGFAAERLVFERGFVAPLVVREREPFARGDAAFRLATVMYHPIRSVLAGHHTEVHEAVRMTATGADGTVALKSARSSHPNASLVLERELKILRRFTSPRLPAIRDVVIARRGGIALALDWRGPNLDTIVAAARKAERIPGEAVALSIGIQLCEALGVIHAARVTHGEVTPDHVLVRDGHVTLCDFGDAVCDLKRAPAPTSPPGVIRARFGYLSPEQLTGEPVDPSTDVFTVAMVVAELIALRHPVGNRGSDMATLMAVRQRDYTIPPTQSGLGTKLDALLVADRAARSSSALLRLELARIAEAAHLRVGPEVIADYTRGLGL